MLQHYTIRPQQWYNVTLKGAQSQNITLEKLLQNKHKQTFPPKKKEKRRRRRSKRRRERRKEEEEEEEEKKKKKLRGITQAKVFLLCSTIVIPTPKLSSKQVAHDDLDPDQPVRRVGC